MPVIRMKPLEVVALTINFPKREFSLAERSDDP